MELYYSENLLEEEEVVEEKDSYYKVASGDELEDVFANLDGEDEYGSRDDDPVKCNGWDEEMRMYAKIKGRMHPYQDDRVTPINHLRLDLDRGGSEGDPKTNQFIGNMVDIHHLTNNKSHGNEEAINNRLLELI